MKNQNIKNYQIERREQLIDCGYSEHEARKIAFQETQEFTRKHLASKAYDIMIEEVVRLSFLSAIQYRDQIDKGTATLTQHQAMQNTKRVVRQMLHN